MPRQKEYREMYTDHCIRHQKDAVSYVTFRWRVNRRWPQLAIRLGKYEMPPKPIKKTPHLNQKKIQEKKMKIRLVEKIVLWVALLTLWIMVWLMF